MSNQSITKGDIIKHIEERLSVTIDPAIPLDAAKAFGEDTGLRVSEHFIGTLYHSSKSGFWIPNQVSGCGFLLPMTLEGWEWLLCSGGDHNNRRRRQILAVFPDASFEHDQDGQLIIYTGTEERRNG